MGQDKLMDEQTEVSGITGGDVAQSGNENPTSDESNIMETKDELPPEGVFVENNGSVDNVSNVLTGAAADFSDKHVGKGGRYRVNPETGEREPVYEAYMDRGVKRYRRAV